MSAGSVCIGIIWWPPIYQIFFAWIQKNFPYSSAYSRPVLSGFSNPTKQADIIQCAHLNFEWMRSLHLCITRSARVFEKRVGCWSMKLADDIACCMKHCWVLLMAWQQMLWNILVKRTFHHFWVTNQLNPSTRSQIQHVSGCTPAEDNWNHSAGKSTN